MEAIKQIKRLPGLLCLCGILAAPAGAAPLSASGTAARASSEEAFRQGIVCYKTEEWNEAQNLLTRAASSDAYNTDSTWYMIITSQIYDEDFSKAINSCDRFLSAFPGSSLISAVLYQRGRALHGAGLNDNAVMALSSFCNEYPDSPLYPSALYWIAECFYEDGDYETGRALYERITTEFPESPKRPYADARLFLLTQREREQKLLHLLRLTGEEYLAARENYERELRTIQTEDAIELRRQLRDANQRISELESEITNNTARGAPEERQPAEEAAQDASQGATGNEELYSLLQKAGLIRRVLSEDYPEDFPADSEPLSGAAAPAAGGSL